MNEISINESQEKSVICRFRPFCGNFQDGYYELKTNQGEFLENVDVSEVMEELRKYRELGYSLARMKGGGVA